MGWLNTEVHKDREKLQVSHLKNGLISSGQNLGDLLWQWHLILTIFWFPAVPPKHQKFRNWKKLHFNDWLMWIEIDIISAEKIV